MYMQNVSINLGKGMSLTAVPIKLMPTSIISVAYSHLVSSDCFMSMLVQPTGSHNSFSSSIFTYGSPVVAWDVQHMSTVAREYDFHRLSKSSGQLNAIVIKV